MRIGFHFASAYSLVILRAWNTRPTYSCDACTCIVVLIPGWLGVATGGRVRLQTLQLVSTKGIPSCGFVRCVLRISHFVLKQFPISLSSCFLTVVALRANQCENLSALYSLAETGRLSLVWAAGQTRCGTGSASVR